MRVDTSSTSAAKTTAAPETMPSAAAHVRRWAASASTVVSAARAQTRIMAQSPPLQLFCQCIDDLCRAHSHPVCGQMVVGAVEIPPGHQGILQRRQEHNIEIFSEIRIQRGPQPPAWNPPKRRGCCAGCTSGTPARRLPQSGQTRCWRGLYTCHTGRTPSCSPQAVRKSACHRRHRGGTEHSHRTRCSSACQRHFRPRPNRTARRHSCAPSCLRGSANRSQVPKKTPLYCCKLSLATMS